MPEAERGRRLATGYSALTRAGRRDPVAFFHGEGRRAGDGLRLDRRGPRPLRLVAVPAARRRRARGAEDRHAARDAPRPLRGSRLRDDVGPRVRRSRGARRRRSSGTAASCPGFRTQLMLQPDEKLAVVVLTNASGVDAEEWAAQRARDRRARAEGRGEGAREGQDAGSGAEEVRGDVLGRAVGRRDVRSPVGGRPRDAVPPVASSR